MRFTPFKWNRFRMSSYCLAQKHFKLPLDYCLAPKPLKITSDCCLALKRSDQIDPRPGAHLFFVEIDSECFETLPRTKILRSNKIFPLQNFFLGLSHFYLVHHSNSEAIKEGLRNRNRQTGTGGTETGPFLPEPEP